MHLDARGSQSVEHRRGLDVGAADAMTHAREQERNRAHTGAGHADNVQTPRL
jgi:hypothetical protein